MKKLSLFCIALLTMFTICKAQPSAKAVSAVAANTNAPIKKSPRDSMFAALAPRAIFPLIKSSHMPGVSR